MISEPPMLPLSVTVKPLACRACWYSAPRMYSSAKFLSPSVIAGLPFPGWPAGSLAPLPPPAAAGEEADDEALAELDGDGPELLQAVAATATTASVAAIP